MDEVIPGVFHWRARHPQIGVEVDSHYVAGSGTAIDPLLPAEGIGWFEGRGVERVVLSNRHHLRQAPELLERFGCPVLCHEAGLHEFAGGPEVRGFAFGERLCDDVVALEMGTICPEDTVLLIESDGGALLFADSVVHHGGEVGFVSDGLIGDDPEAVKRETRARCAALLDRQFEALLFAHGEPLRDGARAALREFAAG